LQADPVSNGQRRKSTIAVDPIEGETMNTTSSQVWTESARALWQRLRAHAFEFPEDGLDLTRRLAREQGWSLTTARAAVDEYRRFCFLASVADGEMTPSREVDEVWHLHLSYTRDYWEQFCPAVLGYPLHHGPTRARAGDAEHFRERYAQTLALYESYFGAAPVAFWPGTRERFARQQSPQRVDPSRYWLIRKPSWPRAALVSTGALTLLAATYAENALALPENPLDWSGGPFLQLYLALLLAGILGAFLLRRGARSTGPARGNKPDSFELAYLAGGSERCTDAAIAALLANGSAQWDATNKRLTIKGAPDRQPPPLDLVARCILIDGSPASVIKRAVAPLTAMEKKLQDRGLLLDPSTAWRARLYSMLPLLILAGFGLAKIMVGLARNKPVGFLVVLSVITGAFALGFLLKRPTRTRAGDAALSAAMRTHARALRAPRSQDMGLAVALLGTAALSGTAYADYYAVRSPPSSSSSDSSGGDSGGGDSGCGGGCGGCGGGD
jgi:uncharacterized protein (TIGR04222 family)